MGYPEIQHEAFTMLPVSSRDRMEVKMTGNADQRVAGELTSALEKLHDAVQREGLREVVFDIRDLYFMNSACFKCFVTFVATVADMAKGQQYTIVFLANPRMHWQDRSLDALRSISAELVRIET